jgi:CrcB protein
LSWWQPWDTGDLAPRESERGPTGDFEAEDMTRVLLIALAGALGTLSRYGVGVWAGRTLGTGFPYGTLIVNVLGCFLIAVITHVAISTELISPNLRLALTTGFMGGLTTYSSFNLETTQFFQSRAWYSGLLNFGVTTFACLAAGLLGFAVARRAFGP